MKKRMQKIISLLLVTSFTFGINVTGLTGEITSQTVIPEAELDSSEKFYEGFDIDAFTDAESSVGVMAVDGEGETTVPDSESYDVYALLEFDYPDLDLSTLEGLDVEARRDAVRDYYKPRNEQIVAQLGLEGVTVSYSAPFADISFDSVNEYQTEREGLITASDSSAVEFVGVDLVNTEVDLAEESTTETTTVPDYPLADMKEDAGLTGATRTGAGIKVGILEQGLPDTTNVNFSGRTVVMNLPEENITAYTTTTHATLVATIVGGSNDSTSGVAPEVEFYCAYLEWDKPYYTSPNNISSCLNWLLNSKYVNVINMSNGTMLSMEGEYKAGVFMHNEILNTRLIYTKFCAYIDYTMATSGCLMVKSAGNVTSDNPNAYVSKPGLSVNVLTVGATNANGDLASLSSYVESEENIHKPEVVAPGENVVIPYVGSNSGTSFSTPVVTGIAALLMEEFPKLKTDPALLKNIIMAGCEQLDGEYDYLDDKSGYGLVNYTRSREIMTGNQYGVYVKNSENEDVGTKVFEGDFYIPVGGTVNLKLSRMILGENLALTNDEITPEMTSFRVYVTGYTSSGTITISDFIWDDSIAYINYQASYSSSVYGRIQIYVAESDVNPIEEITLAYTGATHFHRYNAGKTVMSNLYHHSFCTCGTYEMESHSYPEDTGVQRYCTGCGYPENYLGYN